jgi:hypothetical protein
MKAVFEISGIDSEIVAGYTAMLEKWERESFVDVAVCLIGGEGTWIMACSGLPSRQVSRQVGDCAELATRFGGVRKRVRGLDSGAPQTRSQES